MSDNPIAEFFARVRARARGPLDVITPDVEYDAAAPGGYGNDFSAIAPQTQRIAATLENDLTLTVFSALTLTVQLAGLVRRPDMSTQPIGPNGAGYVVSVIGDRVPRSVSFARGSGVEVLGLSIIAISTTTVPLGACWAIVQQSRTLADGSRVITSTLLSGPVSTTQALGWPGSPVQQSTGTSYTRNISGTTPAPGVDIHETVPLGARWEVQIARYVFNTSAAGGNRTSLWITQAFGIGLNFFSTVAPNAHAPSTSRGYNWAQGIGVALDVIVNGVTGPLPFGRALNALDAWGTLTVGVDPADQYSSVQYVVKESLDP